MQKHRTPSQQYRIIEEAQFTYSLIGNTFEKEVNTISKQGEKQIKVLRYLDLTTKTINEFKLIGDLFPNDTESSKQNSTLIDLI